MKKGRLFWFGKAVIAGLIAFALLNAACLIYQNFPGRVYLENGPTDYRWNSNGYYSQGTEGFSNGRFDEKGYNNTYRPADDKVKILLMGSSHMQAIHVAQNKNTAFRLNKLLHDNGYNLYTYNIGIGAHDFLHCANNFRAALKSFQPSDYVIVETEDVVFSIENLKLAAKGTYLKETAPNDRSIVSTLSKVPYLQLLWRQLEYVSQKENDPPPPGEQDSKAYKAALNELLGDMADLANKESCRLIVFYQPRMVLDEKGKYISLDDEKDIKTFKQACEENSIIFVDLTKRYQSNFQANHVLPHGFSNTHVGVGHLNQNGHEMIAEELCKSIVDSEEQ